MEKAKSYKTNWKRISELGNGGQGTTIKAMSIHNQDAIAAVKILNKQKVLERRARMHRETTILSTLDHPGIPKIIDFNTDCYKESDYNLFFAAEFIEGETLSDYDFSGTGLQEKLILIASISGIINYCHQRGVVHRDIKPNNIIIRHGSITDPVVIDFGISFNFSDLDDDTLTPDGYHLGNRFLILPELKVGEAGKRDMRSDITCVVGLFYFLLTGTNPVVLIDENEQKPHQRPQAKQIIDQYPLHVRSIVNNIFDIGFNHSIDRRFQSITGLLTELERLQKVQAPDFSSSDEIVAYIKKLKSNDAYVEAKRLSDLRHEASSKYQDFLSQSYKELGEDWVGSIRISSGNSASGYRHVLSITNAFMGFEANANIKVFVTGNEVVIHSKIVGKKGSSSQKEVFRQPANGDKNWELLKESVRDQFLQIVKDEQGT